MSIFFVIFLISNINLIGCGENSFYDFGFPHWLFMALVLFIQITIFLFAYNYLFVFGIMTFLTYEPPKEDSRKFHLDSLIKDENIEENQQITQQDIIDEYKNNEFLQKQKYYRISKNPFKPIF